MTDPKLKISETATGNVSLSAEFFKINKYDFLKYKEKTRAILLEIFNYAKSTLTRIFSFVVGRRGIVERSSLIRHPSSRSMDTNRLQQNLEQKNAITAENHSFIKEVGQENFFVNYFV